MDDSAEMIWSGVVLVVVLGFALLVSCGRPGNGEKVGQIARVTDEGVICTTATVLVTGKYGGGELSVTAPERLREQVDHFAETQEAVKIKYHAELIKASCSNGTGNRMLDSIEAHPEGAAK